MQEPHTIIDSLRDYWGLFTALILFGLGVVWWFVRRMIIKIDTSQTEHRDATEKRLSGLDARMTVQERESVNRAEYASDKAEMRKEIREGFKSITDRMDRFMEIGRK